ncbi:hypothetical protein ACFQT0_19560 [Hymenobacter humi]|uniref:Fibronectin type-III domain-containing protein n=1 Tax=Hymenobacter humi TaxID=1411620 RepID=A0ABW2UA71_9BACT
MATAARNSLNISLLSLFGSGTSITAEELRLGLSSILDYAETLGGTSAGSGAVVRPFTPTLAFDSHEVYMSVVQAGPINFSIAGTGNVDNATITVLVKTDGTPVTFDGSVNGGAKFVVQGYPDTSQYLLLTFYNPTADLSVRTLVNVTSVPKFGVAVVVGQPTNFAASLTSSGAVSLAWSAGANATNYVLERATNSAFSTGLVTVYSGSTTQYTDTTVGASTTYFYRVKSQAAGASDSAYTLLQGGSIQSGANPQNDVPKYYQFNGAAQNLTVASASDFDFASSAFSTLFWVKVPAQGNYLSLGRSLDEANGRRWDVAVAHKASGQKTIAVYFGDQATSGGYAYYETDTIATLTNFTRVAVTHDGIGGIKVYVNGTLATGTFTPAPAALPPLKRAAPSALVRWPLAPTTPTSNRLARVWTCWPSQIGC